MSKKPVLERGLMGGITIQSARALAEFLMNEADMDDDLSTVEYYSGMLTGLSVEHGELHSLSLEKEIKAYGIQVIENPAIVSRDDRGVGVPRTHRDQD
jgi:hypothetical protein